MPGTNRVQVEELLNEARVQHAELLTRLPENIKQSVPVDAQGITRAIDHLAEAAGFDESARRDLVRPHAINPAVMHARVFGGDPLSADTVIASFVEGARVRAEALASLADAIGGDALGSEVRNLLVGHPPPASAESPDAVAALRATYDAHERAALRIAEALDA